MSEYNLLSDFDPLISDKPLIVYVDIKSPYAFVAKDPTWALADELGIEIDWRPVTLDIPSYLGSAKLDKRGKVVQSNRSAQQWSGVRYAYMDARRYAAAYGYALRGTEKIWNTRLIHIAFEWVKRSGQLPLRKFIDAVYPPFWVRELDVEDERVVLRCIEQAGVSSEGFLQWAESVGGAAHDEQQAAIFAAEIYGVPGYVHAGEYFFGRENLPRLRSLILAQQHGQHEPPADIANSLPPLVDVVHNATARDSKAGVFLDMRQAAEEGRLEIIAGINSECAESDLARITLTRLQELHPGKLRVCWAELPAKKAGRSSVSTQPVSESSSRGERHRAARVSYEALDQQRARDLFVTIATDSAFTIAELETSELSEGPGLTQRLLDNGVKNSFGFVYIDSNDEVHPFNGRQHLSVLAWALSQLL